jgi:hypothetical protein
MNSRTKTRHRRLAVGAMLAAVAAVAAGIAYSAIPTGAGVINACYGDGSRLLRVVDADAGERCRQEERPLSWQQGVNGYRSIRGTPDEVEVTAVGSGPIGFPTPDNPPTRILTLNVPAGVYFVSATIEARKDSGNGDFLCWVQGSKSEFVPVFTRTSLGSDSGHLRRVTLSATGFGSFGGSGGTLTLSCWQAPNSAIPGSPAGENPTVFYANLNAMNVARATINIQPSGEVLELP